MRINSRAVIHGGCEVRSPWNIKIGNSVIGVGAILDGRNGIEIEDDVVLATGVWIWTEQHDTEDPYFRCLNKGGKVTIKRHAWIGNRVSILPKVTIEEGCVIAAGAVVSKSCEPFNMYGGIPAKIIHTRNKDLRYSNVTEGIWSLY
jgi:acetyltransferase-like isoleucine patch superfamily enzyme